MTELAGVMVGNYFLLECLAHEGMVETYRARPTTVGGYDVMLRLFRPAFPDPNAFRAHFATEVEKLWCCHHPHMLPLLEFGAGEDLLYTVTMFPEVETLAQRLERQRGKTLPMAFVLRLITQLCAALQYAHDQGIMHGNIQPSSIFLPDEETILLTNFSMKHAYQEGETLTAGLDGGNPAYAAPEQHVGIVSPASDIYALGVLLYHLLAGELPYHGDTPEEITLQHTNEPIPSLRNSCPELPQALELVVRVALAKLPSARFPDANFLATALLKACDSAGSPTVVTAAQRRIHVRSRRTVSGLSRVASF